MSIHKYKDWRGWREGLFEVWMKAGAEALATNFSALIGTNGVANLGIPGMDNIGLNWKTAIATCLTQFVLRSGLAAWKYISDKDPEIVTEEIDSNPQAFTKPPTPPAATLILVLSLLALSGCSAMKTLIIHPLQKVHEIHEYNEQHTDTTP